MCVSFEAIAYVRPFFQNLVLINRFWSRAVSKLLVPFKKHSLCDLTLLSQMPFFSYFMHYIAVFRKKNHTNVINLISQRAKEKCANKTPLLHTTWKIHITPSSFLLCIHQKLTPGQYLFIKIEHGKSTKNVNFLLTKGQLLGRQHL